MKCFLVIGGGDSKAAEHCQGVLAQGIKVANIRIGPYNELETHPGVYPTCVHMLGWLQAPCDPERDKVVRNEKLTKKSILATLSIFYTSL